MKSYRKMRLKQNKTKNKRRKNKMKGGDKCPKCPVCGSSSTQVHKNYYNEEEKCYCQNCKKYFLTL